MSEVSAFGSTSLDGGTSGLYAAGGGITQAPTGNPINPTDEERALAKNYLARFDKMKAQRSIFEIHWQNCMT
ncbi:MAG TPA: hypothetical protein VMS08_03440, partial [Candidatus Saccharimonadia bacterium]|nr:hypothetical protein [Candidatus Saccharimonadia bacterium]